MIDIYQPHMATVKTKSSVTTTLLPNPHPPLQSSLSVKAHQNL